MPFGGAELELGLDLDEEESCRFLNRMFCQETVRSRMVNLDVREFKVVKEALKWVCDDDPANPNCFALQLVTKGGEDVSHSVRLLPGREELYQSDETVFPGPPRWLEETEVMPRYLIPKTVIDSLEGVEFQETAECPEMSECTERAEGLERAVCLEMAECIERAERIERAECIERAEWIGRRH